MCHCDTSKLKGQLQLPFNLFAIAICLKAESSSSIQKPYFPLPDADGRCAANLFEPRDKNDAPQRQQARNTAPADDMDDSIPF